MSPREIEKHTGVSRSSVRRIVKRKGMKSFKHLKTPRMSEATRERRTERAGALAERFGKNGRTIERCVWQDEKDFTLEVPLNPQNSIHDTGKARKKIFKMNVYFTPQTNDQRSLWCPPA